MTVLGRVTRMPVSHPGSYGYRPGKSAIDAVRTARELCWRYDWVLDLEGQAYFDSIDRELMFKALRKHTDCRRVLLYIERWLKRRCRWRMLASRRATIYNRFSHWSRQGIWVAMFKSITGSTGVIGTAAIDSSHVKVHRCSAGEKRGGLPRSDRPLARWPHDRGPRAD